MRWPKEKDDRSCFVQLVAVCQLQQSLEAQFKLLGVPCAVEYRLGHTGGEEFVNLLEQGLETPAERRTDDAQRQAQTVERVTELLLHMPSTIDDLRNIFRIAL